MAEQAYHLAIDPGETTGWASFTESGKPVTMDQVRGRTDLYALLDEVKPKVIVLEDWTLYRGRALQQAGSKQETVRLIGAIEYWAWLHNCEIVYQGADVKTMAYRWAGVTPDKNHSQSHFKDAYVHGIYYLIKAGIRKHQQGA